MNINSNKKNGLKINAQPFFRKRPGKMLWWLCLIIVVTPTAIIIGQNLKESQKNTEIRLRDFSSEAIHDFKNNPTYSYDRPVDNVSGFWNKLLSEIRDWFSGLSGSFSLTWLLKFILYIVCPIILIYAILKILNVPFASLFYKKQAAKTGFYEAGKENLNATEFETAINQAVQNQHYREAVRLLYLKTLKYLSDRQMIRWSPGKTNHDFLRELENRDLHKNFSNLVYYFEYIWYGNFAANEEILKKAREFSEKISQEINMET